MKATSVNLLATLGESEIEKLTKEVSETICVDYRSNHKRLSTANLWNIQRRRRIVNVRRYYQW